VKFEDLPQPVRASLHGLARDAEAAGGKFFVFGSFARGQARATSDLDLGFYALRTDMSLKDILTEKISTLPTIRPIELVDFDQLEPAFRAEAEKHILPL
jgi:predicted nucleotidyltransferase